MFSDCISLSNLIIDSFDTSSAINMKYFFSNCSSLATLDLSHFDTTLVTNMEYMFSSCTNLYSIDLTHFNTSFVTNMNNMFSNCQSLKEVQMTNINTSSVNNMTQMFENCYSLVSLNLSSFIFDKTESIERMFANDNNLVYVNLINADDSKIKNMNNLFLGTLENMVFCVNESLSNKINKIRLNKGCSVIDCSGNWINSRKLIIASTSECVDECPEETIFFYDYKCFDKCPKNTLPEDFICKEREITQQDNTNFENEEETEKLCNSKNFFLKNCTKRLPTERDKQKFIKQIENDMINGKLYELALRSIDYKEIFIRDNGTEVYSIYSMSNKNRDPNLVNIDMDDCLKVIKTLYKNLINEIIIFQMEYKIPEFKIPIVEYTLFSSYGTKKLSLNHCKKTKINLYIPKVIHNFQDYKYNPNNIFYYDKCLSYSNENNADLTIQDRKNEFNMNNMSLCESGCTFKKYAKNLIKCECEVKVKFNSFLNSYINRNKSIYKFPNEQENLNNFWVLGCLFNIFNKQVILSNLISQIILGTILFSIIGAIIFYCKESKILYNKIKYFIRYIYSKQEEKNKNDTKNKKDKKNKGDKTDKKDKKDNKDILKVNISEQKDMKKSKKMKYKNSLINIQSDRKMLKFDKLKSNLKKNVEKKEKNKYKKYKERTFNELNNLSYSDALIHDKRTFGQYYISFIMTKNILLFTFHCKNDFNSKIIKFVFLFYSFSIFLFINTIYVTDSILHEIFIFQGKVGIFYYIYRIILLALLLIFIKNILMLLIFTENDIVSLREEKETDITDKIRRVLTTVTMKCYLFFVFNLLSLVFIWVYLACFFTIFKNTQFFVLMNTFISFGISLLSPIVLGIIPCAIRIIALSNRESKNRLCAYYISKVFQVLI